MANLTPPIQKEKLKIKTTVTEKRTIDIEVDLPYYFTAYDKGYYFKIISEDKSVCVGLLGDVSTSLEIKASVLHFLDGSAPVTEEEFNTAFQTALSKIQNL